MMSPVATTPATTEATVFVVDDDPAVRKSLRWLMESVGLKVQTFASAADFLHEFDPSRAGCVVLDVRMPGMSGLELQEQLHERGCRMPMIVMTAYGDVPMAVRAMKSGAIHFFQKPISDQVLLDQIHTAIATDLEQRQEVQQMREIEERYLRLTKREIEVLEMVVNGDSSKQIGHRLGVSYKTIEAHRAKIMRKMEAGSVPHLIRMYLSFPDLKSHASRRRVDSADPFDADPDSDSDTEIENE